MKILLISITILMGLFSTAYAERYRGYDKSYNNHNSRYVFQYGKYPSKPFKYYKQSTHYGKHNARHNCYDGRNNNCFRRGVHRQKGYRNYGGTYLKVPYDY